MNKKLIKTIILSLVILNSQATHFLVLRPSKQPSEFCKILGDRSEENQQNTRGARLLSRLFSYRVQIGQMDIWRR
jgi:hypothetical protein